MSKTEVNILWIDDNIDSLQSMIDRITADSKRIKVILTINKKTKIQDITEIDSDNADVALIDYHLDDGTGKTAMHKLDEYNCIADRVLYSEDQKAFKGKRNKDWLSNYSTTKQVIGRNKLKENLPEIIEKERIKLTDIVRLRGIVIAESIELEHLLNEFLAKYYCKRHKKNELKTHVLESSHLGLSNKDTFLSGILKTINENQSKTPAETALHVSITEFRRGFQDIFEKRNKFAHYRLTGNGQLTPSTNSTFKISREIICNLMKKIRSKKRQIVALTSKI